MPYQVQYPTVDELSTMTPQDVFDRAATHLLKQASPASAPGGRCLYRGPNGTACAVGCLIPESEYRPGFEGRGVFVLQVPGPGPLRNFLDRHDAMLTTLQGVHDTNHPAYWPGELRRVAKQWNLSTAAIDALPQRAEV